MAAKTVENTLVYLTPRCRIKVRAAANLLGTSGDYAEVKRTLEHHAKTRPYMLAMRYGALVGMLEERHGEAGLDMYVRFANWVVSTTKVRE
jgi:hypothetical protein